MGKCRRRDAKSFVDQHLFVSICKVVLTTNHVGYRHLDVIADLLMFLDETPDPTELRDWVEEFATFNEMAGQHDGYYVS